MKSKPKGARYRKLTLRGLVRRALRRRSSE